MKRVLVGYIMDGKAGGIDQYLLNLFDAINTKDYQMDFLTNKIDLDLQQKLASKNCKLIKVGSIKHPFRHYRKICSLIHQNHYDITYFNISTALNCLGILAAKKCGVKKKIIHSHSTDVDVRKPVKRTVFLCMHYLGKFLMANAADEYYACSDLAGKWLFTKSVTSSNHFHVIYNTINVKKFCFDIKVREIIRKMYGIDQKYVIGHVGNFTYSKNQEFLLHLLPDLLKKNKACQLMLIGDGPDLFKMQELSKKLGVFDKVLFLGRRDNVEQLMQAMDIFVLPSHFEGFGIVGLEAQAAGLPCIFSAKVPSDVGVCKGTVFLETENNDVTWKNEIFRFKDFSRVNDNQQILIQKGFDKQEQKNILKILFNSF